MKARILFSCGCIREIVGSGEKYLNLTCSPKRVPHSPVVPTLRYSPEDHPLPEPTDYQYIMACFTRSSSGFYFNDYKYPVYPSPCVQIPIAEIILWSFWYETEAGMRLKKSVNKIGSLDVAGVSLDHPLGLWLHTHDEISGGTVPMCEAIEEGYWRSDAPYYVRALKQEIIKEKGELWWSLNGRS